MEMTDEKTLRILGKRGRVTIPQEVRDAIGMARGDVVSFAVVSDDTAIIKRERICDLCSQCSSRTRLDEIAEGLQVNNMAGCI